MVKNSKIFLTSFILFLLLGLTYCQKAPMNGHLDGRWQIMEIEIKGVAVNQKEKQLYYNFYNTVCRLSFYGGYSYDGTINYKDTDLTLFFPTATSTTAIQRLKDYGIFSNPVVFQVEYLDKGKLILKEGDDIVITLRKF